MLQESKHQMGLWGERELHDIIEHKINEDNDKDVRLIFSESFEEADKEINNTT